MSVCTCVRHLRVLLNVSKKFRVSSFRVPGSSVQPLGRNHDRWRIMNILLIIKWSHVDVMRLRLSLGACWPGGRSLSVFAITEALVMPVK